MSTESEQRTGYRRGYRTGDLCLVIGVLLGLVGTVRDDTHNIVSGVWCLAVWVALDLRWPVKK